MGKTEQKRDVLALVLSFEEPIRADIDAQPDSIKAALNNILGAISQLKSTLTTEAAQERPPPRR